MSKQNKIIQYATWEETLVACGNAKRQDIPDDSSIENQVNAMTYTTKHIAQLLGVKNKAVEQALDRGKLEFFHDPNNKKRIPAYIVQDMLQDSEKMQAITGYERIKSEDIAVTLEISVSEVQEKLGKKGVSKSEPRWQDVRGQWGLPEDLKEFKKLCQTHRRDTQKKKQKQRKAEQQKRRENRHRQREKIRNRLVQVFPRWDLEDRSFQNLTIHIGGPNSGKTHDALEELIEAGSGWYLAPLRLLAFEIYDRLNARGIPCDLLTGEEYIPVTGAQFTASTIEMFNPQQSGECVIIDEAQMLADSDRGWAWTRAMMESQAPEMHIIAPQTGQKLIEQMAEAANIPYQVVQHDRLAPLHIADAHWTLSNLPEHTILVAFSRMEVLNLKAELEERDRTVSVVYGSLPPEVRRKQADRFANGETEICIATDAVGMGLNLPADNVCFYEIEKFDGKETRLLNAGEVQQIGGRAGRYGLSKAGVIGATTRQNLKILRSLYHKEAKELTHARVAPSVEDLELIPGNLAQKLKQWSTLQSIPEVLRDLIKTSDLSESIALAQQLTNQQVDRLGLANALKLVNAPTRKSSRLYWYDCVIHILEGYSMELPPFPPKTIENMHDLAQLEACISCADIYLWLGNRAEFTVFASEHKEVRQLRQDWSQAVDNALLTLDTSRTCPECGRKLPLRYRHKLCNSCFEKQYLLDYDYYD